MATRRTSTQIHLLLGNCFLYVLITPLLLARTFAAVVSPPAAES
jgi:hypothetical protein